MEYCCKEIVLVGALQNCAHFSSNVNSIVSQREEYLDFVPSGFEYY